MKFSPRGRAPVAEQPWLHMLRLQRFTQQGIVHQVDLTDRQIVGRPPVAVDQTQLRIIQFRHADLHVQMPCDKPAVGGLSPTRNCTVLASRASDTQGNLAYSPVAEGR